MITCFEVEVFMGAYGVCMYGLSRRSFVHGNVHQIESHVWEQEKE